MTQGKCNRDLRFEDWEWTFEKRSFWEVIWSKNHGRDSKEGMRNNWSIKPFGRGEDELWSLSWSTSTSKRKIKRISNGIKQQRETNSISQNFLGFY